MNETIANVVDSSIMESLLNEVSLHFTSTTETANTEASTEEVVEQPTSQVSNQQPEIIKESTSRFSGALWFKEAQNHIVTLGGAGGIGSWVAFGLSRLGTAIRIYDPDRVETANLSGQFFSKTSVGDYKTEAVYSNSILFCDNYSVSTYAREIGINDIRPVTICAFDNMEARKQCFEWWYNTMIKASDKSQYLFIDGRLSLEDMQVFCINGNDAKNIERYRKEFLFSDADADEPICSAKQTSHCAMMIGSLITGLYVNFCYNLASEDKIFLRPLPFLTMYDSAFINLRTEY